MKDFRLKIMTLPFLLPLTIMEVLFIMVVWLKNLYPHFRIKIKMMNKTAKVHYVIK